MKRILPLVILFFGISLFGQTKLEHKKKFYKREDGRLFVNKDIPLYLHISDSKDLSGDKYLLESESSPQYSTPFFLDTEGYNTIRTPSKVDPETRKVVLPISDVIFEIYSDGVAPTSVIQYKTAPLVETDGKLYIGKGLQIALKSDDKGSGVEQILYSIDEAPYTEYEKPLTFPDEKDYLLNVYAVDNVGNVEQGRVLKFTPDYSPPQTNLEQKTDFIEGVISPRTTFVLNSKDNLSGVKFVFFSYDGGKNNVFQNFISPGWISEGEHTLTYFAKDKVDNEEVKNEFKFFMDKTPPQIEYEIVGDLHSTASSTFISSRSKIKLTATDNKAGVKDVYYSVNGKKAILYTEPFLIDQKAVNINIRYYATDHVNNSSEKASSTGATSLNLNILRDNEAPDISINYKGPNITVNKILYLRETSVISITANDGLSGVKEIKYKLDDAEKPYEKPFSVSAEGKHKVEYRARDNANNESQESLEFYIDNNGPEIGIQFGIGSIGEGDFEGETVNVYPPKTSVFITATDQLVGYDKIIYSLNNATEIESKGIIKNMKVGKYHLKIRALDKLGNETRSELRFIIE